MRTIVFKVQKGDPILETWKLSYVTTWVAKTGVDAQNNPWNARVLPHTSQTYWVAVKGFYHSKDPLLLTTYPNFVPNPKI